MHRILYWPWLACLCCWMFVSCDPHGTSEGDRAQASTGVCAFPPDLATGQQFSADSQRLLTIVNWNIEWLGSTRNGPKDKDKQLEQAIRVLKYLKADLYCLCEIVDPVSLKKLTKALGDQYQYKITNYASGAHSASAPGYAQSQKMAYIYDARLFKNIQTAAFLKDDSKAGYNFAGGRYPYLLQATVQVNGTTESLAALLIHAKAGADRTSYQRRLNAATALKRAVEVQFEGKSVIMLGDFNDEMIGSISAGKPSPYQAFAVDPLFNVLTWDAAAQGDQSTLDFPTVIDQQIVSAALNRFYVPHSARIRKDVTNVVKDYTSGKTSDHYPVSSVYLINVARQKQAPLPGTLHLSDSKKTGRTQQSATNETNSRESSTQKTDYFTADVQEKSILIKTAEKVNNIQFILYNARDRKVLSVHRKYINKGDSFSLRTPKLYSGQYELVIFASSGKQKVKQVIAFKTD